MKQIGIAGFGEMGQHDWNERKLSRIMTGWSVVDADPVQNRELYEYQKRIVDFNLNAERLVAEITVSGAEVFYFHAKSHTGHVWFNSKIGHKVQALGERDLVAELVGECRKRNIATVGMFQICLDRWSHNEHPEWRQINAEGQSFGSRVCFNNPDYRRYILALIGEAVANYELDGVMVDEFDFSGRHGGGIMCYCPHCRRLFEDRHHAAIPVKPDWENPAWRHFIRFRLDSLTDMVKDVRNTIKGIRPDILLTIVSYSGISLPWQRVQPIEAFCKYIDFFSLDTSGALPLSVYSRLFRAYSSEKAEIIGGMQPFLTWCSGESALPVASRVVRLSAAMTTVANNLSWNVDICYKPLPADRVLDSAITTNYAEIAGEIERRRPWLEGKQASLADMALYYSEDTKIFYGRDDCGVYTNEFTGCFKALLESQTIFDIIGARHLDPKELARYKVITLPAAACLSDKQAAIFRQYVQNGGALIVTHNTSLFDGDGVRRDNFALADVFGVSFKAEGPGGDFQIKKKMPEFKAQACYGFFQMKPLGPLSQGIEELSALLTPTIVVAAGAGVEWGGDYLLRNAAVRRTVQHVPEFDSSHMGPRRPDYMPATCLAALNKFGRGRSIYLAAKFGSLYLETGFAYAKTILVNAIRQAYAGQERIKITAPAAIEATAFRDTAGRVVVHLVNYQSAPLRGELDSEPQEFLPVHDVRIEYRLESGKKFRKAYQAPEMIDLKMETMPNGRIACVIPKVQIHTMLVLET